MKLVVRYVEEIKDEQLWELQDSLSFNLSNGEKLIVPAGFRTDFATIPKIVSLFIPSGVYNFPSLVHDYYYTYHGTTRKEADKEFLHLMNVFVKDFKTRNKLMYYAVRLFGLKRWNNYGNS